MFGIIGIVFVIEIILLIKTFLFIQLLDFNDSGKSSGKTGFFKLFIRFSIFTIIGIVAIHIIFRLISVELFHFFNFNTFYYILLVPWINLIIDFVVVHRQGDLLNDFKAVPSSFLVITTEILFFFLFVFNRVGISLSNNQVYIFVIALLLTAIICILILILHSRLNNGVVKLIYMFVMILILNLYIFSFRSMTSMYNSYFAEVQPDYSGFLGSNLVRHQELVPVRNINIQYLITRDYLDINYEGDDLYFLKHTLDSNRINIYKLPGNEEFDPEIISYQDDKPIKNAFYLGDYIFLVQEDKLQALGLHQAGPGQGVLRPVWDYKLNQGESLFYTLIYNGQPRIILEKGSNLELYSVTGNWDNLKLVKVFKNVDIDSVRNYKVIQVSEDHFLLSNIIKNKKQYYMTDDFRFYENVILEPYEGMSFLLAKSYYYYNNQLYILFISSDNNLNIPELFIGIIGEDNTMRFFPLAFYYKARYYKLRIFEDNIRILMVNNKEIKIASFPLNWKKIDTDEDGLTDLEELRLASDYNNPDTDFDGIPDPEDTISLSGNRRREVIDRIISTGITEIIKETDPETTRLIYLTNYKLSPEYLAKRWVQQFTPGEFMVWIYRYGYDLNLLKKKYSLPEFEFGSGWFGIFIYQRVGLNRLNIYINLFGKPVLLTRHQTQI